MNWQMNRRGSHFQLNYRYKKNSKCKFKAREINIVGGEMKLSRMVSTVLLKFWVNLKLLWFVIENDFGARPRNGGGGQLLAG